MKKITFTELVAALLLSTSWSQQSALHAANPLKDSVEAQTLSKEYPWGKLISVEIPWEMQP